MQVIEVKSATDTAEARRRAVAVAEATSPSACVAGNVALVATELATNLLRHGGGGELLIGSPDDGPPEVEMIALDRGKGMSNVEECLRDGYSTAGGAGTGLGAVFRLSRDAEIYSLPERGTAVLARVGARHDAPPAAPPDLCCGGLSVAMPGETLCGDAWRCVPHADGATLFVADGLGHGPLAASAARAACRVFEREAARPPAEIIELMHDELAGTRGAAIAVARIAPAAGTVTYCGIGNIAGVIIAPGAQRHMVSLHGIVGVTLRRTQEYEYPLPPRALLVMHSDGIASRWSLDAYPGVGTRDPALIAGLLYRDFTRRRDDSTVAVVRID